MTSFANGSAERVSPELAESRNHRDRYGIYQGGRNQARQPRAGLVERPEDWPRSSVLEITPVIPTGLAVCARLRGEKPPGLTSMTY